MASGATAIAAKPQVPTTVPAPPYEPAPITPIIHPALPGEGAWTAMDTWDPGPAAILTTAFRPDPAQPTVTAYVAWLRSSRTQLALYPGYKGPGTTPLSRGPEMVPLSAELICSLPSTLASTKRIRPGASTPTGPSTSR